MNDLSRKTQSLSHHDPNGGLAKNESGLQGRIWGEEGARVFGVNAGRVFKTKRLSSEQENEGKPPKKTREKEMYNANHQEV